MSPFWSQSNVTGSTLTTLGVDGAGTTPRYSVGAFGFRSQIRLGLERTRFNLSRDSFSIYEGDGTLLRAGGSMIFDRCVGCRSFVAAEYQFETVTSADDGARNAFTGRTSELDFKSHGFGLRYGYRVNSRFSPSIGGHWIRSRATVTSEGERANVDLDRNELMGGVAVRLGRAVACNIDMGYDHDKIQPTVTLFYRF